MRAPCREDNVLHIDSININIMVVVHYNFASSDYWGKLDKVYPYCLVCITQLCLTLCDPMDCSPPGSSIHGILRARILEWLASSFSRGSLYPGVEPRSLVSPALADGFFTN